MQVTTAMNRRLRTRNEAGSQTQCGTTLRVVNFDAERRTTLSGFAAFSNFTLGATHA